uniref:Uncharacterized protein n=1 Tax=Panagrolaimus sp. ES5 TaxID=591445 RepID=A0AC34GKL9_9BILA
MKGLGVIKKAKKNDSTSTSQPSSSSTSSTPGPSKPPDKCLPSSSKAPANTTISAPPLKKGLMSLGCYNSDSD